MGNCFWPLYYYIGINRKGDPASSTASLSHKMAVGGLMGGDKFSVQGAAPGRGNDEEQKVVSRFMSLYFDISTKVDLVREQGFKDEDPKFHFGLVRSLCLDVGKFVKTLQSKSACEQLPCNGTASISLMDYCSRHRECRGCHGATVHPGNCTLSGLSNSLNPTMQGKCSGSIKDSEHAKKLFKDIECCSIEEMVALKHAARMSALLSSLVEELKKCQLVGDHVVKLRPPGAPYDTLVRCNQKRLDWHAEQRLAEFVQIFAGIKDLFCS